MRKAIYPGSFDPLHEGHIAIIKKALKLFDVVYVVVTNNPEKVKQTDIKERFENVKSSFADLSGVIVEFNEHQMTADFARERDIKFLIRSARNQTDFNYELELAAGNNHLNNDLETVLLVPEYEMIEFESRLIKQTK